MPLFGNKFSPKKGPQRKFPSMSNLALDESQKEFDSGQIKVTLGGQELTFDDGQWLTRGASGANSQEVNHLKTKVRELSEEVNLYKYKIDFLLDKLAEKAAEQHLLDTELDKAKKELRKRNG